MKKKILLPLIGAALALSAGGVAAQGTTGMHGEEQSSTTEGAEMGEHTMPATVSSVNHKNGIVHVTSEGMKLVVHFPTTAVSELKKGDKITLHLGYSKE
jgi:hypothetical protein